VLPVLQLTTLDTTEHLTNPHSERQDQQPAPEPCCTKSIPNTDTHINLISHSSSVSGTAFYFRCGHLHALSYHTSSCAASKDYPCHSLLE
jgi:hypothetical protein